MGVVHRFLHPTSTTESYRPIKLMEIIWGLKPFSVTRRQQVYTSRIGLALTILHILVFVACSSLVLVISPATLTITDSPLAIVQTNVMALLRSVNTFIIFVQIFAHRDRDFRLGKLVVPMDKQFEAIGCDMPLLYRRTLFGFLKAAIAMALNIGGLFLHGMYFFTIAVPNDCRLAIILGASTVLPLCYIQMVLLQFGICALFVRRRMEKMNRILLGVLETERNRPYYIK